MHPGLHGKAIVRESELLSIRYDIYSCISVEIGCVLLRERFCVYLSVFSGDKQCAVANYGWNGEGHFVHDKSWSFCRIDKIEGMQHVLLSAVDVYGVPRDGRHARVAIDGGRPFCPA